MKLGLKRCGVALLLAAVSTLSHALVFAVNEGVTYRVPNEEIRAKYALIAADLSKLLRQPVTVEPIGGYPALRQGWRTRRTTSRWSIRRTCRSSR
jgi:hypothetical protein